MMTISRLRIGLPLLAAGLLAGCATVPGEPDPRDPLESMNRSVYQFNDTVDRNVVRPVTLAYRDIVPPPVRSCVSNFFGNLWDVWSAANSVLQGRVPDGINSFGRVLMNTTLGVFGCYDRAAQVGVPRIANDFGTTLGVWGVGPGPYLVLPVLGPSTVRDAAGRVVDSQGGVIGNVENVRVRNTMIGTNLLDTRSRLLEAGDLVDDLALDPYSFVRDAYLQQRQRRIRGGDDYDVPDYSLPDYGDDPGKP